MEREIIAYIYTLSSKCYGLLAFFFFLDPPLYNTLDSYPFLAIIIALGFFFLRVILPALMSVNFN